MIGLFLIYQGWLDRYRDEVKKNWPTAEGRVDDSTLYQSNNVVFVEVVYKFDVGESEFSGRSSVNTTEIDSIPNEYLPGSTVVVHYDPENPGRSYLVGDASSGSWGLIILGAIVILICLPFIIIQIILWYADLMMRKAQYHMREGLAALEQAQDEIDKLLKEGKPLSDDVLRRQDEVLEQANQANALLKDLERQRKSF